MNNAIDWELGTKLAGNSREAAEELLTILVKNLPDDLKRIKKLWQEKKYSALLEQVIVERRN